MLDLIDQDAFAKIGLGLLWRDIRFEWSSGDLIYRGCHTEHGAATTDTAWYVWKYTWSGSDLTRIEGPIKGSWDGKAALF